MYDACTSYLYFFRITHIGLSAETYTQLDQLWAFSASRFLSNSLIYSPKVAKSRISWMIGGNAQQCEQVGLYSLHKPSTQT